MNTTTTTIYEPLSKDQVDEAARRYLTSLRIALGKAIFDECVRINLLPSMSFDSFHDVCDTSDVLWEVVTAYYPDPDESSVRDVDARTDRVWDEAAWVSRHAFALLLRGWRPEVEKTEPECEWLQDEEAVISRLRYEHRATIARAEKEERKDTPEKLLRDILRRLDRDVFAPELERAAALGFHAGEYLPSIAEVMEREG